MTRRARVKFSRHELLNLDGHPCCLEEGSMAICEPSTRTSVDRIGGNFDNVSAPFSSRFTGPHASSPSQTPRPEANTHSFSLTVTNIRETT